MHTSIDHVEIVRWLARLASAVLLLFWGAFFIEHLSWFIGSTQSPPAFVWPAQGAHLLLLIGFVLAFKWERAGSGLIIVAALLFFTMIGVRHAPLFILVSIVPALLYLYCSIGDNARLSQLF